MTVALQAPLSMKFSGKNAGVGYHSLLQESSQPKDWTWVSHVVGRFFTIWATRETLEVPDQSVSRISSFWGLWGKIVSCLSSF